MKTRTIITIIIAGIIALTALVGVVIGISTHTEEVLLDICWRDGVALYKSTQIEGENEENPCERYEELVWPSSQIPLAVAFLSDNGEDLAPNHPYARTCAKAAENLNTELGFKLYQVEPGARTADIRFYLGKAFTKARTPPGYVLHMRTETPTRGTHMWSNGFIRADVVSHDVLLYRVCQHELLHVVGLAHDLAENSIMHPTIIENWETPKLATSHITDSDKRRLRKEYHQ